MSSVLSAPEAEEAVVVRRRMTLKEFNALPDDPGVERFLSRGELWEKPMTKRNRRHSQVEAIVSARLVDWAESQPAPQPEVFSGEAGVDLPEIEAGFGIDVVVFSGEAMAAGQPEGPYLVGVPLLAVEILSPSDRHEEVVRKVEDFLDAGVRLVWIVDPDLRTVTVHRPDAPPVMFNETDQIEGESLLPGFHCPVARLLGRR